MNNKLVYVGLLMLAFGLNGKAYSTQGTETVIASDLKREAYISGAEFLNDETGNATLLKQDYVKHGYEIVKRGDGTCYKRTTLLHGMQEFTTSVPGIVIEAPKTTTVIKDVDCNVRTLVHVE